MLGSGAVSTAGNLVRKSQKTGVPSGLSLCILQNPWLNPELCICGVRPQDTQKKATGSLGVWVAISAAVQCGEIKLEIRFLPRAR